MNRETPRRWTLVTLLVLALLIASVAGATAQEAAPGSGAPKSGALEVVHFDDFESGRSMETYWLVDESGQRTELQFPDGAPAGLLTGRRISVAGESADGVLQVRELSGEAAPAAVVTGEQRALVLTVNFQDRALSCTNTQVEGIMFTGARNTDGYYRETSYNNIWFTGLVSGPYTINYSTTSSCDYYGWANAAEAAAQAAGINVSLYNRRVYVMPSAGTCGTWAGLGTLGGNPSRSWIASCGTFDVYPHELGHNLTMHHSSTDPNNDGIVDVEYGDTSDIMGYAGIGWRQLNAPHKEEMGWLPPAKYQTVTAGGTYSIAPTELDPAATTLPQALKIARSGGGNYYISYRVPIGYDAGMPSAYSNKTNIHHWSGASGAKTMFLATLTDGGVWSETSGSLSVKQVSRSADAVTVEISFQCVPAAPSVTVTPASQGGAAGATLSYNVSVKNNDVSSCPTTTFNLAGTAPSGWTAGVTPAALTLSPGQTGPATLAVTSPAGTPFGSYVVGVSVSDGELPIHNGAGSATYVVDGAPPTAPSNLKASVKPKSITLTWSASSDNVGVTGYQVYRNSALLTTVTGLSYKDNAVTRGRGYTYYVIALDAAGNVSGPSNSVTVTAR